MSYEQWKTELIAVTKRELKSVGYSEPFDFKINDEEARKWYDSGATPYICFRETYPQ